MKRQWRLRRELQPLPKGEYRWDQAYQHLLQWTQPPTTETLPAPPPCSPHQEEVYHETGAVCARIDPTSGAGTNH
jgi:hypothetical protein